MKSSTKYVGLDVHQATTVATVRDESGRLIARNILPTGEAALLEFFAGMRGRTRSPEMEVTHAEKDCSEGPGAPRSLARGGE